MKKAARLMSIVLLVTIILCQVSVLAFAEEEKNEPKTVKEAAEFLLSSKENYYPERKSIDKVNSQYPDHFDLRDKGFVTPVKSQEPFGTCWGFSAIAASETSILSKLNKTYEETKLDLSEHHLSYFARQYLQDGSSQDGEGIHVLDGFPHFGGATIITATSLFSSGIGVVDEEFIPYRGLNSETSSFGIINSSYSENDDWTIPSEYEFYQKYELEESSVLQSPAIYEDEYESDFLKREATYKGYDAAATEAIKKEVYEGRAVSIAFCADSSMPSDLTSGAEPHYINTIGNNWSHYTYDGGVPNHAVTIIGWDDNFPATEFLDHSEDKYGDGTPHYPEGNGAWICKNSWGAETEEFPNSEPWGNIDENGKNTGYFYLSYYDRSISDPESFDYDVTGNSNGYIIDQYDYMQAFEKTKWLNASPIQMSNIFTAEYDQVIKAVSCETNYHGCDVLYQVYILDKDSTSPDDGKLVAEAQAEYVNAGYHRINLSTPVEVSKGQKYSIVVTQKIQSGDKEYFEISCDSAENEAYVLQVNKDAHRENPNAPDDSLNLYSFYTKGIINKGESFIYIEDLNSWYDFSDIVSELQTTDNNKNYDYDNFSIKAYSNFKNDKDVEILYEESEIPELNFAPPAGAINISKLLMYGGICILLIALVVFSIIRLVRKIKKRKCLKKLEEENRLMKEKIFELTGKEFECEKK